MSYIRGERGTAAPSCPFCAISANQLQHELVVHRGPRCFVVLNLYPYNAGHLMVVPHRHVADYPDLDADETLEVAELTQHAVRTIRSVSRPDAFNVGMNLGASAGGSVADHLHQHVVPRWSGDANFMTVIGQTKTLPQLLEDTRDLLVDAWGAL